MRKLANVIDLHDYKIRAALRELEQGRAIAEAAQAILDEAAEVAAEIRPPRVFGTCVCADCMRWASDLPCGNYPACTCCGRPVQPRNARKARKARKVRRVRKAVQHPKQKRSRAGSARLPEEK